MFTIYFTTSNQILRIASSRAGGIDVCTQSSLFRPTSQVSNRQRQRCDFSHNIQLMVCPSRNFYVHASISRSTRILIFKLIQLIQSKQ
jgi:hypothetical protein